MTRSSFLQSSEWEEVQQRMGRTTARVGDVLVVQHAIPFGLHYLYTPRPPKLSSDFFSGVRMYAASLGPLFLRVDPTDAALLEGVPLRYAPSLQPQETILIDCRMGPEELLRAMHEKTRYNIRLARRHGVTVRAVPEGALPKFWPRIWALFKETAERDRFSLHPESHYRVLFTVGSQEFTNELWVAELDEELLAAIVVNWYRSSNTVTYLHGASSRNHRGAMAPYLLHWSLIEAAHERRFHYYDFGGIGERWWPGITRFKKGFGGETVKFPPSYDLVFRPFMYRLYRIQHSLRHRVVL